MTSVSGNCPCMKQIPNIINHFSLRTRRNLICCRPYKHFSSDICQLYGTCRAKAIERNPFGSLEGERRSACFSLVLSKKLRSRRKVSTTLMKELRIAHRSQVFLLNYHDWSADPSSTFADSIASHARGFVTRSLSLTESELKDLIFLM